MFLYLWVPISGACFGSHFGFQTKGATKETIPIQVPVLGPCFGPYQVMTFYQWVDFLRTEADGRGLEIEWLNLDETSVPQSFVDCQGNIARVGPRQLPCHNIPLHRRRGCATFVCVVAASARLQAVMPQVWIGNKRVFRAKDLREVAPEIPHNCLLWREATSWNTAFSRKRS